MSRAFGLVLVVIGLLASALTAPMLLDQARETPATSRAANARPEMWPHPTPTPTPPPGAPKNGEAWGWTQLTPRGTVIRWATTEQPAGVCPTVNYTYQGMRTGHQMVFVSGPFGSQFPTTVCRLPVPDGATNAVVQSTTTNARIINPANLQLPLPRWQAAGRPRPNSIVVIGDAGCEVRFTNPALDQNCSHDWPFQPLSVNAAALSRPELVIEAGDYVYREQPQAANDATPGCDMQGQAADWGCLVKDFFRPAEALLAQAPFIFARGNHEVCTPGIGRGAEWFRYLNTVLFSNNECFTYPQSPTQPVQINAGTLHFVLMDTSSATPGNDFVLDPQEVPLYRRAFNQVNALAANNPAEDYFLISHKPLWMVQAASSTAVNWTNPTLARSISQTALGALAPNIRLVFSGHEHLYQLLGFSSTRPPQLTVGSSGSELNTAPDDSKVIGKIVDNQPVTQSISQDVHGYLLLRDQGSQWHLTFHDTTGSKLGQECTLSNGATKQLTCV